MLSETCLVSCADNFITDLHFCRDLLFIISGPLNHIASLFKIHPVEVENAAASFSGIKDCICIAASITIDAFAEGYKRNKDVLNCTATDIAKTKVLKTYFEGKQVF